MCGIAGFFGKAPRRAQTADAMLSALRQRGPDSQHGVTWDQEFHRSKGPIHHALLHARLAIIDPRPEADQPMANDDQSLWLSYNGEVYGWAAAAAELQTGDRLLRLGGVATPNLKALSEALKNLRPGETVEIEFSREAVKLTGKLLLGER